MGLDLFVTAICSSGLGYGLCYITLSCNYKKSVIQKDNVGNLIKV